MSNYIRSGEWHIIHIDIKRNDVTYPCCPGIYYPDVTIYGRKKDSFLSFFSLHLFIFCLKINLVRIRRRILYYLFNIIFPCIWLSILSLLGFWLPPDSGEKITLGITVLLAFSVFMLLIAESMPATSEMVPLIEIYLTIVMALTSMSIVLTVYVLQLHHSGPVIIPIPHSFKYSLVRYIAPAIGMTKIVRIYAEEHDLIDKDDVYRIFAKPKPRPIDSPLIKNKKKFIQEKINVKYHEETDNDGEDDNEIATKEFLSNPSFCNGDIRSSKRPNHHRHHHRSHARVPQIVLIPQQSHSSSPIPFHSQTNYDLFQSNMYLLEQHLKHLVDKQKLEEERNEIVNEWKLMALIMDRLLFWLFASLTILSTVLCLIIIPCLKNAGYIRALAKELLLDLQTVTNLVEEQVNVNLTK